MALISVTFNIAAGATDSNEVDLNAAGVPEGVPTACLAMIAVTNLGLLSTVRYMNYPVAGTPLFVMDAANAAASFTIPLTPTDRVLIMQPFGLGFSEARFSPHLGLQFARLRMLAPSPAASDLEVQVIYAPASGGGGGGGAVDITSIAGVALTAGKPLPVYVPGIAPVSSVFP